MITYLKSLKSFKNIDVYMLSPTMITATEQKKDGLPGDIVAVSKLHRHKSLATVRISVMHYSPSVL